MGRVTAKEGEISRRREWPAIGLGLRGRRRGQRRDCMRVSMEALVTFQMPSLCHGGDRSPAGVGQAGTMRATVGRLGGRAGGRPANIWAPSCFCNLALCKPRLNSSSTLFYFRPSQVLYRQAFGSLFKKSWKSLYNSCVHELCS